MNRPTVALLERASHPLSKITIVARGIVRTNHEPLGSALARFTILIGRIREIVKIRTIIMRWRQEHYAAAKRWPKTGVYGDNH